MGIKFARLQEALNMYNTKSSNLSKTLNELGVKRYELLKQSKNHDLVNENYNYIVGCKYNARPENDEAVFNIDFNVYKNDYIKNIKTIFTKYPQKFVDGGNLNKYLDNVKMTVNNAIETLKTIDNKEEFDEEVINFYEVYSNEAKVFINEYFYETMKKNKDKAKEDVIIARDEVLNEVLNYDLNDLKNLADKKIKQAVDKYNQKSRIINRFRELCAEKEKDIDNNPIFNDFYEYIDKKLTNIHNEYEYLIRCSKIYDNAEQLFDEYKNKYLSEINEFKKAIYLRLKGLLLEKNQELYNKGLLDSSYYLYNKSSLEKSDEEDLITRIYYLLDETQKKSNLHK